jgi:hypothetical protein
MSQLICFSSFIVQPYVPPFRIWNMNITTTHLSSYVKVPNEILNLEYGFELGRDIVIKEDITFCLDGGSAYVDSNTFIGSTFNQIGVL